MFIATAGLGLGGLVGGSIFSAGRKASKSLTSASGSISASIRSGAHEIAEAGILAGTIHAKILAAGMLDCVSEFNANNQRLVNEFNANNRQCIDRMVDSIRHVSDDFNANNRQIVDQLINWANGQVVGIGASLKTNLYTLSFLLGILHPTIIGMYILLAALLINPQPITTIYEKIYDASTQPSYSLYDLAYKAVSIIGYTIFWYIQFLLVSQLLANRYDKLFKTIMSINPLLHNAAVTTRPHYIECFHVLFPKIQADVAIISVDLQLQLINTRPFALSFLVTYHNSNLPVGHNYMTLHLGQTTNPPIAFVERCYENYHFYSVLHDTVIVPWDADGNQSISVECTKTLIDGAYPGHGNSNWYELKLVGIWSN